MKTAVPNIYFSQKNKHVSAVITASRRVCRKLAADWGAVIENSCLSDNQGDLIFASRHDGNAELWKASWCVAELIYLRLVESGVPPSEAEEVLPDSVMATAKLTLDIDGWKRFCGESDPHLSQITLLAASRLKEIFPADFEDLPLTKSFSA